MTQEKQILETTNDKTKTDKIRERINLIENLLIERNAALKKGSLSTFHKMSINDYLNIVDFLYSEKTNFKTIKMSFNREAEVSEQVVVVIGI